MSSLHDVFIQVRMGTKIKLLLAMIVVIESMRQHATILTQNLVLFIRTYEVSKINKKSKWKSSYVVSNTFFDR